MFVTRGEAIGFALRTRKNLEYVRHAFDREEDVHVVTHVVNSLLNQDFPYWESSGSMGSPIEMLAS